MLNVLDVWIVDQNTFNDLEFQFYVAIRTDEGKTYQSRGFKTLERADGLAFKIMDSHQADERAFFESCPYGIDKLELIN